MRRSVVAVLVALLVSTAATAEIPQVLGYQGRITENTGIPVANGTYSMQFRIYDAETGGTLLWDSGSLSVDTNAGVFSVMLGESPQPVLNLPFDQDYWLLVTFRGQDQLPRKRLGSVGYAYMASGLVPGTEVSGPVTTSPFAAIKGANTATSGVTYGLYGTTDSPSGCAICGINSATTGSSSAVYGESNSPTGYAGFFEGNVYVAEDLTVDGTLSGSGVGDITAVTAGTGLDGGGTSGDVTLDVSTPLSLTGSVAGGVLYGVNTMPADDASGVCGEATGTVGGTWGVMGRSFSTGGTGVMGMASAGTGVNRGVAGFSLSTSGRGVYGYASTTSGANYGVYGATNSSSGIGVCGMSLATTGNTSAIYGESNSPSGYAGYFEGRVYVAEDLTVGGTLSGSGVGDITAVTAGTGLDGGGTSGDVTLDIGVPLSLSGSSPVGIVEGTNTSTFDDARGVTGHATGTSGLVYGVMGISASSSGTGVSGVATATAGTNYGIYGETNSPSGYAGYFEGDSRVTGDLTVDGWLDTGVPLTLTGTTSVGVIQGVNAGAITDACGLRGEATATSWEVHGVMGLSASTAGNGVFGRASSTAGTNCGVQGRSSSTSGRGVFGYASTASGTNYGVYGKTNSPTGYAGYFEGDAYVTGDLTVDGTLSGSGVGDITAVTAGTGLDGGGTSGDVTLDVETPLTLTGNTSVGVIQGVNAGAITDACGLRGEATATSWEVHGVMGMSASTAGNGVFGYASSTSGTTSGVSGRSASTSGRGVFGYASTASGTNYGVYGKTNSTSGYAGYFEGDAHVTGDLTVDGWLDTAVPLTLTGSASGGVMQGVNTNTLADASGLRGEATATTGQVHGVVGLSASTAGTGVFGYASSGSGTTYGVYGRTDSPSGYAGYFLGDARVTGDLTVDGTLTGAGVGDITAVTAGTGLDGGGTSGDVTLDVEVPLSLSGSGGTATIQGTHTLTSGTRYGLWGESASTSGRGVHGTVTATTGTTLGVYGRSASTSGRAVYGYAAAATGTNYGVYGLTNSASGYGVFYSGGLGGTGAKSCVVKTSQGPTLLYCQESPENWFEDFGEGRLVDGKCRIELDPLFLETVTIDTDNPMKVFITPDDPACKGVSVVRGITGFEVVELHGGAGDSRFAYRVVAKRKGFETKRLDYCKAAETDPYLYPELREKELPAE